MVIRVMVVVVVAAAAWKERQPALSVGEERRWIRGVSSRVERVGHEGVRV